MHLVGVGRQKPSDLERALYSAGAHSPTEGDTASSASLSFAEHSVAWHQFCWNEKIGRAALDSRTMKHCGRRFGLHTKAARVLIAFSVITAKVLNYSLHVLRMTGFSSASSQHSDVTWRGDARFGEKIKKRRSLVGS